MWSLSPHKYKNLINVLYIVETCDSQTEAPLLPHKDKIIEFMLAVSALTQDLEKNPDANCGCFAFLVAPAVSLQISTKVSFHMSSERLKGSTIVVNHSYAGEGFGPTYGRVGVSDRYVSPVLADYFRGKSSFLPTRGRDGNWIYWEWCSR